jgi:adenine deaminase
MSQNNVPVRENNSNYSSNIPQMRRRIALAKGQDKVDFLIRNAKIINVFSGEIYNSDVAISDGIFVGFGDKYDSKKSYDALGRFMCPGLIEGHIHVESTLLSVREFCNVVALHGTSAVICDPHEIANVLGLRGIDYMIQSSRDLPVKIYLMMPSCVPATPMETSGAKILENDISNYLHQFPDRIIGLGEMMNYRGVISEDVEVLAKVIAAGDRPKDGHAPLLSGTLLDAYVISGLRSDHECSNLNEAREKLRKGMHILIREGTQEKNMQSLIHLINNLNASNFSLVSDDRDPLDLKEKGHLDYLIRRAIFYGIDPIRAIQMASINTARYFGLHNLGAIAPGFRADFTLLDDLETFSISKVFLDGKPVNNAAYCNTDKDDNNTTILRKKSPSSNFFGNSMYIKTLDDPNMFTIPTNLAKFSSQSSSSSLLLRVIGVIPGQIITENRKIQATLYYNDENKCYVIADPQKDVAKLAVIERHHKTGNVGLGFVQGLGLKRGAIASSIAHDSHNLIIAGMNDVDMLIAARYLTSLGGGLAVADGAQIKASLALPIAGLMSHRPIEDVIVSLKTVNEVCKKLGDNVIRDPLMLLSFLSLSVVPSLKLTDRGLVDVDRFEFTELFVE